MYSKWFAGPTTFHVSKIFGSSIVQLWGSNSFGDFTNKAKLEAHKPVFSLVKKLLLQRLQRTFLEVIWGHPLNKMSILFREIV